MSEQRGSQGFDSETFASRLRLTVEANLDMRDALDPLIQKLEREIRIRARYHNRRDYNILLTVPGIGDILALTILYEIHTIDRFPTVQRFSSYARLVKCERESAGKKTSGGNQKACPELVEGLAIRI